MTARKTTKTTAARNPVAAEAAAPAEAAGAAEAQAAKAAKAEQAAQAKAAAEAKITQRRAEVATLTGEGLVRRDIAARLGVSVWVVRDDQKALGLTAARPAGQPGPQRERVVQLAGEGKTTAAIATVTGLSVAGVRHHLQAAGVTAARPEPERRVSPNRAAVAALASEGKTAAQIAASTGLSVAGVRWHLKAAGVTAAPVVRTGTASAEG